MGWSYGAFFLKFKYNINYRVVSWYNFCEKLTTRLTTGWSYGAIFLKFNYNINYRVVT